MISERIVGQTDARVEVTRRRVRAENVRHLLERSERRSDDRIQGVDVGGRIGDELVTDAHVDGELLGGSPFVMDVAVDFDLSEIAIGVGLAGLGPLEEAGLCLEEGANAGEGVEAAPPAKLEEVALDASHTTAHLQAVCALGPDDVVGNRKLVLHFQQRSEDAGADGRQIHLHGALPHASR